MRDQYLPFQRSMAPYEPDGLRPVGARSEDVKFEVVGSCAAGFLLRYTDELAKQLDLHLDVSLVTHNHPVPVRRGAPDIPDVQLVLPPLRYMHPETLDDFFKWEDHAARLEQSIGHLGTYLDHMAAGLPATQRFVTGFMEPFSNPVGFDHDRSSPANFKVFVRHLNEALAAWCDERPGTWFIDLNEISAVIGRGRTDEELLGNLAHRTAFDPYDDWVEANQPIAEYSALDSFDMQAPRFYLTVMRHMFSRRTTVLGRDPVKLVIIDLDNTLWRGLASDGHVGLGGPPVRDSRGTTHPPPAGDPPGHSQ